MPAENMSVWRIEFTGVWVGLSLVAAPTARKAWDILCVEYQRIHQTEIERIRGLTFTGEPRIIYGRAEQILFGEPVNAR